MAIVKFCRFPGFGGSGTVEATRALTPAKSAAKTTGRLALRPQNLLILMSDEHNARMMGCAGHPLAKTPPLDALAARGTRFVDAYTSCPICVPARASFATGRHI